MNIPPPTAIIKTEFKYNPINKITAVTQRKRSFVLISSHYLQQYNLAQEYRQNFL